MTGRISTNPLALALGTVGVRKDNDGKYYYEGGKDDKGNEIGKVYISNHDAVKIAEEALAITKATTEAHDLRIANLLYGAGLKVVDGNYQDASGNNLSPYELLTVANNQHNVNMLQYGNTNNLAKAKNELPTISEKQEDDLRAAKNNSDRFLHAVKSILAAGGVVLANNSNGNFEEGILPHNNRVKKNESGVVFRF